MFTYKTQEEVDKMTATEYETYTTEKSAHEADLRKKEIDKAIEDAQKNNATKEEIEALTNKNAEIVKEIERLSLEAKKASEVPTKENKTFYGVLKSTFEAVQKELDAVISGEAKQMTVKAVVNITDATTIDAVGSANHINLTTNTGIISKIRSRILAYLSNVSVAPMAGNRVNWIEELDEQGTPIFIAEAGAKTKISVRYEEREMKSKKIGVYGKVSTEMLRNLPMLVPYIQSNLMKRVDIATEDQLFGGDGTGNNLTGLAEYAVPFTGGSLAGTLATPNVNDVFRAIALQVQEAFGTASALFVEPSVIAKLDVSKDDNGSYLLPPFRMANGNEIAGMTLIASTGLPSGVDFIGGDLSVVQVRFADAMNIQIGQDGNDFTNNLKTILVEQELLQFVSANDAQVLVQGTIATAITALTID
jgi:HK97 family phage major capsid protein